jgi:hypothetical protein
MKILLVGINKTNINYKKVEGFYNAFSKIGIVEWVQDIFSCKGTGYDLCFGEININDILSNIESYKNLKIKTQIFWSSFCLQKIIFLANLIQESNFFCYYKSNVLNKDILTQYKSKYGESYQFSGCEGLNVNDFIKLESSKILKNLTIGYLPCCLSEKGNEFCNEKIYDICYFGTILNRPRIAKILNHLSNKYNVISTAWDKNIKVSPNECIEYYKKTKLTISEQISPVVLEYPVRMGECSANGCKFFLLEEVALKHDNFFIPNYEFSFSEDELISKIEIYLQNYELQSSFELFNSFISTYDNAVQHLIRRINL